MKKLYPLLLAILLLLTLTACSEKDDDNPTDVHVWAYSLDQFINQALVADSIDVDAADTLEFRGLYNYEIVSGADGFSPRASANAGYDLSWDLFRQGYFVPSNGNRTWFADALNLPGAFKVSDTGFYRMYRKIDVVVGDLGIKPVELRGLPIYPITNWDGETEDAIKLADLVQGVVYDSISIVCYDDYGTGKYYQEEAVEDGYYLLNTERTIFPTATLPNNMKKMKKVAYVEIFSTTPAIDPEPVLAPQDAADMIFVMPTNLDSYEATDLNGIITR